MPVDANPNKTTGFFLLQAEQTRLRRYRQRATRINERQMAWQLGISYESLRNKFTGGVAWQVNELGMLCRLLDCTMADIFKDEQGNIEMITRYGLKEAS